MTHLSDDDYINLIARCALRDQKALKQLYDKASPYLNQVAYRILRSEELSNDVLQEAFVQIWQHAGEYRPSIAKPLTWMTSILRYRALDRLAYEKRYHDRIDPNSELSELDIADASATPEGSATASQHDGYLKECLNGLNERTKTSITMAYLQGFSREEIANKFSTNVNTIKSWLHRGVNRLKTCIDQKTNQNR